MAASDSLDADKIGAGFSSNRIGRKIVVFSSVSSTNDIAAEYAKNPDNDGTVILAEEQSAGRGRGKNKWQSNRGDSITLSIVLTKEAVSNELLSLALAAAAAQAISPEAKIKWPNDIFLNGKKIAGILVESKNTGYGTAFVIGIGINCHQKEFPADLAGIATSIDIENKETCDRTIIIRRLLSSIEHCLETAHKDPQKIIRQWEHLSLLLGQRITVVHNKRKYSGTCSGIDPQRGLILQLDAGKIQFFPAGQTSIFH